MRTPHSSTNKGKRVKITMRDGEIVTGKFKDKKSGVIILEDVHMEREDAGMRITGWTSGDRRFHMKDIRAFSIYKPLK